jgi:hypothetical protein
MGKELSTFASSHSRISALASTTQHLQSLKQQIKITSRLHVAPTRMNPLAKK